MYHIYTVTILLIFLLNLDFMNRMLGDTNV